MVAEYATWCQYSDQSMRMLPAISSYAIGTEMRLPGAKLSIIHLGEENHLEII